MENETLERKIEKNEVEQKENDRRVIYTGEVAYFFDGLDIEGSVKLNKYDDSAEQRKYDMTETKPKIWSIQVPFAYFVSYGKTCDGYACSGQYRPKLKSEAFNKDIMLSREIIEKVFGPIDKKLMERYLYLKNF